MCLCCKNIQKINKNILRHSMLVRRFERCARDVKITLFKALCVSLYSSSISFNTLTRVDYTQMAYSELRVQYNNAFRVLLGLLRWCSGDVRQDADRRFRGRGKACFRASLSCILSTFANRWDCPMLAPWTSLDAISNGVRILYFYTFLLTLIL